jgi:hypothetical protein
MKTMKYLILLLIIFLGASQSFAQSDTISEPEYYVLSKGNGETILIDASSVMRIDEKAPDYYVASTNKITSSNSKLSVYAIRCGKKEFHKFLEGQAAPSDIVDIYQQGGFYKVVPGTDTASVYNFVCNADKRNEYTKYQPK